MESIIDLSKNLQAKLEPHTEEILRLQDILMLRRWIPMVIIAVLVNIIFALFYWLHLSSYSVVLIFVALGTVLPKVGKVILPIITKAPLVQVPEGSIFVRFSTSDIAAFVGSILYLGFAFSEYVILSVRSKDIMKTGLSLFGVLLFFFLFLSIPDFVTSWIIVNVLLWLPFLIRCVQGKVFQNLFAKIWSKLTAIAARVFHRKPKDQQTPAPEEEHQKTE